MNWNALQARAKAEFKLGARSIHGPSHWERVERNGLELCADANLEADAELVRLFAWLHDCKRQNEGRDPQHGLRAARLATSLNDRVFSLSQPRLMLLCEALRDHDRGRTHLNPTIGACWDADRLDLERVGLTPDPARMSTEAGKRAARELNSARNGLMDR